MTRYHNVNGEKVPFTAQEETDRDAEEAQVALDEPMELWKQEMREADGGIMPRIMEDILDGMPDKSGVNQITLDKLQAKKTLRETKP